MSMLAGLLLAVLLAGCVAGGSMTPCAQADLVAFVSLDVE